MISITTILRNGERAARLLPIVKDLLPNSKDGLNSLTVDSEYKIKKLEDALTDKKAEICTLREKIEELEAILEDYRSAIGAGPTKEDL